MNDMTSQESCCKIVDFQEYLGKKELELQMKQIVNREIMVIVPTQLSQIVSVGKKLLLGETVILNLNYLDAETTQRFMDFVCGICYTVNGILTCISTGIYIASVYDYIDTAMTESKN